MTHIDQADLGTPTQQEQRWARGEFRVPEQNLEALEAKIARLNKRAAKLGCAPATLERLGTETEPVQGPNGKPTGALRVYVLLRLRGEAPKLAGWAFVAALDVLEGGTLIRAVPGEQVPVAYRTAALACDHCRLARKRVKHYLLRHDDGRHVVVGSSCLADFLGHQNPDALARGAEYLASAADLCGEAEGWGAGGGSPSLYETVTFLAAAVVAIEKWGWRSRTTACERGGTCTANDAQELLDPKARLAWTRKKQEPFPEPTPEQQAEAAAVHAWLQAIAERPNLSDYEHNLQVAGAGETMCWAHAGLVASAVVAYRREHEQEVKRRTAAARPKSTGYIGEVGKRVELEATVTWLGSTAGDWGTTAIVKLLDAEGRLAVWFSSRALPKEMEQGTKWRLTGTVKAHKDYKGDAETVLTRCKVVGPLVPQEAR